jgi:hypothetical protein
MAESEDLENVELSTNPDPITGEPGAHPVGTGIGAAAAGAAATAIGATAGPIGAVVGAVVGSVIGGLVGKSAAEATNPTVNPAVEEHYWRESYSKRHYARPDRSYDAYQLAYQVGYEGYTAHTGENMSYAEIEPELEREYDRRNDGSSVSWDDAKYAVRDAWERAKRNDFFFNEDLYWRDNYRLQPYYNSNLSYQDYQPAYRLGYEGYVEHANSGKPHDEIERELRQSYDTDDASSTLPWDQAVHAVRDAWNRADQVFRRY